MKSERGIPSGSTMLMRSQIGRSAGRSGAGGPRQHLLLAIFQRHVEIVLEHDERSFRGESPAWRNCVRIASFMRVRISRQPLRSQ